MRGLFPFQHLTRPRGDGDHKLLRRRSASTPRSNYRPILVRDQMQQAFPGTQARFIVLAIAHPASDGLPKSR
jgi:hypothetical protein